MDEYITTTGFSMLDFNNATNVTKRLKLPAPTSSAIQFTFGVLGNVIAILVLLKHAKEHKWKTFYRLVAALSLTDLFGILTTSPVAFVMYANKFKWPNNWLCDYMSFMMIFASMATMLIVWAMSLDRYVAVWHPFYYGVMMKKRRIHVITAGIWVIALIIASFPLMGFGHNVKHWPYSWCFFDYFGRHVSDKVYAIMYATIGLMVIVATTALNGLVIIALVRGQQGMARRASTVSSKHRSRRNEVFIMVFLVAILLTFAICWTPLMIRIYINVSGMYQPQYRADIMGLRFASVNQILDPWIYILFRKEMLVRFLRLLGRKEAESSVVRQDSMSESSNKEKNKVTVSNGHKSKFELRKMDSTSSTATQHLLLKKTDSNSSNATQHLLIKHL